MIIDTSVIVSILRKEPGFETFINLLEVVPVCRLSAASLVELSAVIGKFNDPFLRKRTEEIIQWSAILIADVTESQARIGQAAYQRYGKGSGHPAKLNFGDCFSYALAIDFDEPLLFKGNDFSYTDVRIAHSQDYSCPSPSIRCGITPETRH